MRAADAKLADKIAFLIRDAVAKIKAALSGTKAKGYSEITKSLDRWQELADLFAEGVAGAMSAYENGAQTGGTVGAASGGRYSLRVRYSDGSEMLIKNPSNVSEEKVIEYLENAKRRKYLDESYLPLGRIFPNYLTKLLRLKNVDAREFPLVMSVKEAKRAQAKNNNPNSGEKNTGHGLSAEQILNQIDVIYSPENIENIFYQPNGRISMFTKGKDEKSDFIVFEFDSLTENNVEVDEGENRFDVVVTLFAPDEVVDGELFDYYDYLISRGSEELYDEQTIREALADLDTIGQTLPMSSATTSLKTNSTTLLNESQAKNKFSLRENVENVEQTKDLVAVYSFVKT